MFELAKDLLHFFKHLGSAKLSDDKVVVKEIVVGGASVSLGLGLGFLKSCRASFGSFLEAKKRGEPEGRSGFCFIHVVFLDGVLKLENAVNYF